MQILKPTQKNIELAVKYLRQGKAVIFPTDTAYGLGVDATNPKAIQRLYRIKKRRPSKPVHIVVSSVAMAKRYVALSTLDQKVLKEFLPGPLSLICNLQPRLLRQGRGGFAKLLSAGSGTVGIRMPKNSVAMTLVRRLGKPITATSANISFAKTAYTTREIIEQFKGRRPQPDLVLDAGDLPIVAPSTMVRIEGGRVRVLRRGPLSKHSIETHLK